MTAEERTLLVSLSLSTIGFAISYFTKKRFIRPVDPVFEQLRGSFRRMGLILAIGCAAVVVESLLAIFGFIKW